jgi:hypothetical protein
VRDIILIWRVWNVKNTFLHLVYHMLPVSLDCPFLIAPSIFCNIYLNFIFLLNERIYLFWKQTISHLIKSLKNVRKSNINYCKCTIEKVHETNRMLKPQIWNRMLKSQIWNRMLKSQICITQVNTSQSKLEISVSGVLTFHTLQIRIISLTIRKNMSSMPGLHIDKLLEKYSSESI